MKSVFFLVAAALIIFCSCADDKEPTCTIHGLVNDSKTGEPVRAAMVELSSTDVYGPKTSTVTGNDGYFEFSEVPSWGYVLVFKQNNYEELFLEVRVEPGQVVRRDVLLTPFSKIFGVVTDLSGEPRAGTNVRLHRVSSGTPFAEPFQTVQTDLSGYYEFRVASGSYDLRIGTVNMRITVSNGNELERDIQF